MYTFDIVSYIIIIYSERGNNLMPLDGIVVNCLSNEFNNTILNGRLDKIYQPEKDELIFIIRAENKNRSLLLSADPNNPRVYFTDYIKENPSDAPMFCMLLRKHLLRGRIVSISQPSFERILIFNIESYNEMGDLTIKSLIIELMGRHSNIILLDSNNIIIDSIKHIDNTISSVRTVLPGYKYIEPPSQGKLNPLICNHKEIEETLLSQSKDLLLHNAIVKSLMGISPLVAKEISYRAVSNIDINLASLSDKDFKQVAICIVKLFHHIKNNVFEPILLKKANNTIIDFSAINISFDKNIEFYKSNSISNIMDTFYFNRDLQNRLNQKTSNLLKIININLDRCNRKLEIQKTKLHEVANRDELKLYGDLIIANIYKIQQGDDKIKAENFYLPVKDNTLNYPLINIPLNPQLTPAQNAQKYFQKYSKAKNAVVYLKKQIKFNKEEIRYLESLKVLLINAEKKDEIDEIREEMFQENYIKKRKIKTNKQKKGSFTKPLSFLSSDNFNIYVGKNNRQNDYLSLKFAHNNDLWFHSKTIPGSHVIIKRNNYNKIPDSTILEAAILAAYYSKGRFSSNIAIDYTEIKNVKKPSGSKPGMVIYDNYKTLYVTPDESLVKKLKGQNS